MLKVLENWYPGDLSKLEQFDIEDSIKIKLRGLVMKLQNSRYLEPIVTVRPPFADRVVRLNHDDRSNGWHSDCSGSDMIMIIWSSVAPTHIRPLGGVKLKGFKGGDIIMFSNNEYEHKTPGSEALGNRWFARVTISRSIMRGEFL